VTQTPAETYADDKHRYRLDSRIATGGMGEVWRATDTALGRTVAVKLLKAEYADDATFRSRFETEARHAAALSHPGVAGVFDVGEGSALDGSGKPRPYLVMELVDGQPLSALLVSGRELDPVAVRDLMAQTGDALGAAHRAGIVHRDVKPANLMVTPGGVVKVTDFGIARAADGVGITRTGAVMGTPQYLSPEQAEGKPATARSDVYALGVVTFECLSGRRPFEADSPVATALAHLRQPVPSLPDHVPAELTTVVSRALSKDPEERYADGTAFAAALRDPVTAATQVVPGSGGGAGAAGAAAAGLAAGALGGAALADAGDEQDHTRVMGATGAQAAYSPDPTPADGTGYDGYDDGYGAPVAPPPATGSLRPDDDEPRRSSTGLIVAAVLAAVLLIVVIVLLVNSAGDDDEPTANPDPTTSAPSTPSQTPTQGQTTSEAPEPTETGPAPVVIDSADYEGDPVDDVDARLSALGLNVARNEIENPGGEQEGIVESVNPDGTLLEGDQVTVNYYGAEPTPEPTEEPEPSSPSTTTSPSSNEPTEPTEPTETGPANRGRGPGSAGGPGAAAGPGGPGGAGGPDAGGGPAGRTELDD